VTGGDASEGSRDFSVPRPTCRYGRRGTRETPGPSQSAGRDNRCLLPETVTVGGEELSLAEFIIETRKVPGVPPEHRELLADAKKTLRNERTRRLERLESDPLDRETAETLADEIIGLDRALHALENIRKPNYGETARTAAIDDHKRWAKFLDTLS